MIKLNKQFCNYNSKRESLIDKMICLVNKKMNFSLISYLLLFCLLGAIFFLVKFDITQKYHNIVNIAMAESINGTDNADNITGTINKDVIKGLNGNDTISGKEAGDDISGGSGDDLM